MVTRPTSSSSPQLPAGRPLHIVHAVLNLECGGLEHVVSDLAETGLKAEHRVTVICLEQKGTLASRLETLGINVISLAKPAGLQIVRMRRALRRLLVKLQPDVVHCHQIGALFYIAPVSRAARVPVTVHTEHGKHFEGHVKMRWLGRYAAWHADRYFCVSQDIATEVVLQKIVSPHKVEVVPNGIDTSKFSRGMDALEVRQELGIPIDAQVIGTVGRLAEIKRQNLLIRAFSLLLREIPDAHLLLVGDGPLRKELESLAAGLGVSDRIRFTGYRDDRERLYRAMDLFALTSRSEGMPLSVLEAWASEIPVVAACVGGIPELVDDGQNGVLIADAEPARWADELAKLLGDQAFCARLVIAGRKRVEDQHSLLSMLRHYEDHYREILESRPKAGIATDNSLRR